MIKKVVVQGRKGEARRPRAGGMKRTMTVLVALGLVLSQAYAADGRPKKKEPQLTLRRIRVPYELGTGGVGTRNSETGGVAIPVKVAPKERFMDFHVNDWTGLPVRVSITTRPSDGWPGIRFCGATNGFPIRVPSGKTIYFWVRTGTCDTWGPAMATHGWIDVTFGNRYFVVDENERAEP